ncbi:MAG: hypothetical protein AAFX05_09815 [Planctomycetota bacterium]
MSRLLFAAFAALSVFVGCCSSPCTIDPPQSTSDRDTGTAIKLAAELEQLPAEGELTLDFKNTSKVAFQELDDKNAALLLLLRAIKCYLEEGEVGQDIARSLAEEAKEEFAGAIGMRGGDGATISRAERRYIQQSDLSGEILDTFEALGIE